jgi:hypothetical protein
MKFDLSTFRRRGVAGDPVQLAILDELKKLNDRQEQQERDREYYFFKTFFVNNPNFFTFPVDNQAK